MSQRIALRGSDKLVAFQNLSVYYTCKNIRKHYNNIKFKVIAPTWNDEFDLPYGSYGLSDVQHHIEFIIKKHETLTKIHPIYVDINRINNRLVFEIKDGYKLELQTREIMKLFGSTKKLTDKTKSGEKVLSLEVVQAVI